MATSQRSISRAPSFARMGNPIVNRLLGAGFPMGPNAILTVRGRTSGTARRVPVAVLDIGGRRWIQSPFGNVNWVRNLRAAGAGTITIGKRSEPVTAVELTTAEKVAFFSDVLAPYIRSIRFGKLLISMLGARDLVDDPEGAALTHPVFELHPVA